ncbi:MAG: carboxypeptidase regulatory-like domain-containing protein [bacterium]
MPARIRRTLGFGVLLASWSASGLMGTGLAMAQSAPRGGAQAAVALDGQVTSMAEGLMEGVVVTAKRDTSTIAVSVISDAEGWYRFPADTLEAGRHALSIRAIGFDLDSPRAAEVGASGTTTLDLTLRPTLDVESQLTNAEWLESIPGTETQKRMFESCVRCHTLERILRSRYDADAWLQVLERMDGYVTSAFPGNPQRLPAGRVTPLAERSESRQAARRRQAAYLASVNLSSGPRAHALQTFPRPMSRATRVVITEYDLPDKSRAPHDAEVGPDGMVWYPDFGQQYLGRLDPHTGEVTEYRVPEARPGNPTGILALRLDRDGNPWGGNMFQGAIFKFDRQTETFQVWKVPDELEQPKGAHGTRILQVNHAAPESSHIDGKVWLQNRSIAGVHRLDLAPRNERGRVEYVVDFVMRKPVDLARSSGVLRYDAPNRGNTRNVDPYFQGLGHILLAAGWQGDVPGGTRRLRVEVPVARQGDGAAVTGRVRAELITRRATHTLPLSGGAFSGTHVPYAAASLDQPTATLTQRRRADDPADLVGAVRRAHGVSSRCAAEQRRETSESPPACQGQSTRGCLSQGRPSPARTRSADRGETDRCDSRDPIGPASARNA